MESVRVALPPLLSVSSVQAPSNMTVNDDDGDGEPPMLIPAQSHQRAYSSPDDREVEAELSPRESHAGQFRLQLWQFLLLLLSRPEDFGGTIKWTDDSGEFKVYDTEELARLWGGRKGRNTMNYDKLSRSLRYYYDKGILKKVTGQRLVYRFDSDIHRRHVHQLKQGLSGVVALSSTRSSGNAATLADSPAAQHTSDEIVIKQVKRERQERTEGSDGFTNGSKQGASSGKRPRKEKSGIEEHQASSMEASLLFGRALREGCITLPRTRLYLTGPRKSGKSSLKKLLIGALHAVDEATTDGIDADNQVAVFDPDSPYHNDSTARSSLKWRPTELRHNRLREFERRVSKWVAADLMSFSHEIVQHRMPASQQAMLHSECHQLLVNKGPSPTSTAGATAATTMAASMAIGPQVTGMPTPGPHIAPATPCRTPPKLTGAPSPTTAGTVNATQNAVFASSGAVRPVPVAVSSTPRFVPPGPAAGGANMYWAQQQQGTMVNGTSQAAIVQPLYLPTLAPGPFFLSPPPQAQQRYMVPALGGNMMATNYPAAAPVAAYGSATGPFPDLPEELASRVAAYMRQARSKGMSYFTDSISPLAGGVHIWDMPGDLLFSSVASLVMVRHAIYVVTFDLSLDLHLPSPADVAERQGDDGGRQGPTYLESIVDSLDFIRACTSDHHDSPSVQKLVPAVVIVGTHLDALGPTDSDSSKQLARERFATVKRALQGRLSRKYVTFPFFAVDCTKSGEETDNADLLRFHIEDLTQNYFPTAWPFAYLRFEQILETERRRGLVCQPLSDVLKITKSDCLLDPPATYTMLCHMHNLGLIMFLPHVARMDDMVVIRPQWLLGAINRVICTLPANYESGPFAESWRRLITEGVLEERLVAEIWQDYGANQGLLLDMMQRLDLLCPSLPHLVDQFLEGREEPEPTSADDGVIYYVPSMVQVGPDPEEFLQSLSPERGSEAVVIVFADNFIPSSLFPHLLQRCLLLCPMRPRIFNQCARLVIDSDHDLLLLVYQGTLKVIIEGTDYTSEASPPSSDVCVETIRFITKCLREFEWQYEHGIDFEVCVKCTCSAPGPIKPPSGSINLTSNPDGEHYMRVPVAGGKMPLGSQYYGEGDEVLLTCARGTESDVPLNVQIWLKADVHCSDTHPISELLHYNLRHRLCQLIDPHLSGRGWQILGSLLGFSPHEMVQMERSDSPTMALMEAWEGRSFSSVPRLREKVALLRCDDAIDLLDSI